MLMLVTLFYRGFQSAEQLFWGGRCSRRECLRIISNSSEFAVFSRFVQNSGPPSERR